MSQFFIDNSDTEAGYHRVYKVETCTCEVCKLLITDEKFYKDKHGRPYYFATLSKDTAVMFCGPVHSSEWTNIDDNKNKIWNKKDGI